jgi:S-formylglutathione hydrolase
VGAGGTCDSLYDVQPLFDAWWADGAVPPMLIATPTPGNDYYIEENTGPLRWDSFLVFDLIPQLRSTLDVCKSTVVAGISGGGYGALKLAFAHPHLFTAVAAMHPLREPGFHEAEVGARKRLHHSAAGPAALIGDHRDSSLWEANNPANRARDNVQRILDASLAIYLEAGDRDFLNAHDGTEFLHRVLWNLDLSHEYHLVRNADHGGPTMRQRMQRMFAWLGSIWKPANADPALEQATTAWLQSGMTGKPPAGATTTDAFVSHLRAVLESLRARAAETDPSTYRRFRVF